MLILLTCLQYLIMVSAIEKPQRAHARILSRYMPAFIYVMSDNEDVRVNRRLLHAITFVRSAANAGGKGRFAVNALKINRLLVYHRSIES